MMVRARKLQLALLFGSRLVQTVLRMSMGPLLLYICDDFECTTSDAGALLASFSLGYLATQLLGGILADRVAPKLVIALAAASAGVSEIWSGSARSITGLLAMQVCVGVCQGPQFPASIAHLTRWLPPEERVLASTVLDAGITVGSMLALPFSGTLAHTLGWRRTLHFYGWTSVLFACFWSAIAVSDPEQCSYIGKAELQYLRKNVKINSPQRAVKKLSIVTIITHRQLWAIYGSHIAFNYTVYLTAGFASMFYRDVLEIRPDEAKLALFVPPLLNLATVTFGNPALEKYMRKSMRCSSIVRRRAFSFFGFASVAVAVSMIRPFSRYGVFPCAVCFALSNACSALHTAGFKANYLDVTLYNLGMVAGFGNTLASLAACIGPLIAARLLHFGWEYLFVSVAGANVIAAVAFVVLSSTTPIDDDCDLLPLLQYEGIS